ncbi:DegV [Thermacetogenium phaeum DSM 12270]|uniref:DegV n=1 Tax=Thermacetogenium phaeum (strain ATCC BAA-254 / DSM 26808 / PB) TaxID=1089553 RepID=K4LFT1_THEPS|nr:DegV family protein [Thermacetogenium phaeum]AFV11728.1 DegV [Thermacetogenium phaeum DSM 12270]
MKKIGFVTDSTAYLPPAFKEQHQIEVVSLTINFEEESYPEVDLFDDFDGFYKRLRQASTLPTTSQPSIGDFLNVYQKLGEKVESIISVHITEGISGTIKSARSAAAMLPELDITVVDSNATAVAIYMILKAAVRAADAGLEKDKVLEIINYIVDNQKLYFLPETLEYLRRGGRIGGAAALIGTLLQIRPILFFNKERNCIIDVYEKVRTREKGLQRILEELERDYRTCPDLEVAVVHVGAENLGQDLMRRVQNLLPDCRPDYCPVGPVIGAHIGPGTVGLYFYPVKRQHKSLLQESVGR